MLVGVGLPMESTGAMEGLARGCTFLNPKYTGNQTGVLQNEDKPTNRKVPSRRCLLKLNTEEWAIFPNLVDLGCKLSLQYF